MITRLRRAWRDRRVSRVEVCETCGVVCDAACRATEAREVAMERMLANGPWR